MSNYHFTEDQKAFIQANWYKYTNKQMAKMLGFTDAAIKYQLNKMNIKNLPFWKKTHNITLLKENIDKPIPELCEMFHKSYFAMCMAVDKYRKGKL